MNLSEISTCCPHKCGPEGCGEDDICRGPCDDRAASVVVAFVLSDECPICSEPLDDNGPHACQLRDDDEGDDENCGCKRPWCSDCYGDFAESRYCNACSRPVWHGQTHTIDPGPYCRCDD